MVLICLFLCRSVSLSLFFFPPSSSAYAPILISISSIVLRLISSSLFPSRLHPLPASQYRRVPPALALPLLFFFPSSSSAGLSISPGLFPLPSSSPSSFVFPIPSASSSGLSISPLLLLLLRAILLCSRCSARRKYSLFTPPLIWLKRQFVLF